MGDYTLLTEPDRGLLRMTLSGFFSIEEVAALDRERAIVMVQLSCATNQHLTLCDIRDMQISTQEVVAAFTAFASNPRYTARKLAMVTHSSLARSQARRVTARDRVAYFEDIDEAEHWLFDASADQSPDR